MPFFIEIAGFHPSGGNLSFNLKNEGTTTSAWHGEGGKDWAGRGPADCNTACCADMPVVRV